MYRLYTHINDTAFTLAQVKNLKESNLLTLPTTLSDLPSPSSAGELLNPISSRFRYYVLLDIVELPGYAMFQQDGAPPH